LLVGDSERVLQATRHRRISCVFPAPLLVLIVSKLSIPCIHLGSLTGLVFLLTVRCRVLTTPQRTLYQSASVWSVSLVILVMVSNRHGGPLRILLLGAGSGDVYESTARGPDAVHMHHGTTHHPPSFTSRQSLDQNIWYCGSELNGKSSVL